MERIEKVKQTPFETHLTAYETLIGAPAKANKKKKSIDESLAGRREYILIADLHLPYTRNDLLVDIIREHKGKHCIVLGDLSDFDQWSKYDPSCFTQTSLKDTLAQQDSVLQILEDNFSQVDLMLGNHDNRCWTKAQRVLSNDYGWLTHEFMMLCFQKRHNINLISHSVKRQSSDPIDRLYFYYQIGDCVLSHVERSGGGVASGAISAHDWLNSWGNILGLKDWNVLVHSHTHKISFHKHKSSNRYIYELGTLCDVPEYALRKGHTHRPPEHGYVILIQDDGVTNMKETRLICLD